ncbi:MAG: hypothetical protein KJO07_22930, partial [Deltaproteobacteria bacterium]|nr:hypothetical protein [Deltaproteobacteria bacterium]
QATQSTANAQAPAAPASAQAQDQYRCFYPKGGLASLRLSESINEVAAQGYQLVAVTQAPGNDLRSRQGLVVCMRRTR